MHRLDRQVSILDTAHKRLRSIYSRQDAYPPFHAIARVLNGDLFEQKVARALSCITAQIDRYRVNKRARVSNDQELERDFGREVAGRAIESLTEEQEAIRARALALRAIMSKRNGKD